MVAFFICLKIDPLCEMGLGKHFIIAIKQQRKPFGAAIGNKVPKNIEKLLLVVIWQNNHR